MRSGIRLCLFPLVSFLLLLVAPTSAQQIRFFPDFSSPSNTQLRLNGNATINGNGSQTVLRLTNGATMPERSSAFFDIQQPLNQGFTTWFQFQLYNPTGNGGDGFAFVIQNSTNTDTTQGATGSGLTALGSTQGGVGYSGINNSLAIEFDVHQDPWDPNSNHIAVQTCGGSPSLFNSPVHVPGSFTIGNNHNITSCLLSPTAINTNIPQLVGGPSTHQAVISYTPPAANQQTGLLQVWLDPTFIPGTQTPVPGAPTVLSEPYNLVYSQNSNPLGLAHSNTGGTYLVGFTGSQPDAGDTIVQDVFGWIFTPQAPVQIQQPIQPGGTPTNFVFGAHQFAVNYPNGVNNPGISMTVLETPVNQQTFYNQRLLGTAFANENCIIYLQTGGDCVVYSVTCQQNGVNVTCPQQLSPNPEIAMCTKFTTNSPINGDDVDYLRAEPIGSNNWCSIFSGFQNNNDPVVSGKGRGLSDFVATLTESRNGPQCDQDLSLTKAIQKMKTVLAPAGTYCPPTQ
jgi:hypothetical protein